MAAPLDQFLQNPPAFRVIFNQENSHLWSCKPFPKPFHQARANMSGPKVLEQDDCQEMGLFSQKQQSGFSLEDRHRIGIAPSHLALHSASARYSESLAQRSHVPVSFFSFLLSRPDRRS